MLSEERSKLFSVVVLYPSWGHSWEGDDVTSEVVLLPVAAAACEIDSFVLFVSKELVISNLLKFWLWCWFEKDVFACSIAETNLLYLLRIESNF